MKAVIRVDGFSGTILVARDGKPIVSKGYGMANIELNVPNSPQNVFRLGSVTKQFTAMSIMMLQERGIRPVRTRAHHPQTNGKVERFHQTLKKWLRTQPRARTPRQRQLDAFR